MARYSVATTKDHLSSLIDKALAGEEVVITRHGRPVAELKLFDGEADGKARRAAAFERLRDLHDRLPRSSVTYQDLKRMDEEDGAL